jgi:hypothetical protein
MNERLAWEYADGPEVGRDIPITSEPREELAPGVPAPTKADKPQASGVNSAEPGLEERTVQAADPNLSPETNARLTEALRDVIGATTVTVPQDRPHISEGERPESQPGYLGMHRFQLIRGLAIVLTFAAIVALATGKWWLLPVAAGVHALGTMTVWLTSVRMMTTTERASPTVAAALSEAGVTSPDEHFSKMVAEFQQEPERTTADVISPGSEERTIETNADSARANVEQESAMTPSAGPSTPAQTGDAPDRMIWVMAFSLLVLSFVLPAAGGGGLQWLLPAVMVPALIGWLVLQRAMITRQDARVGRGSIVAIVLATTATVAVFCGVVAIAFAH